MLKLLPYIVITLHLILVPYSKVEESFHTQATHDTLYHLPPASYFDIYGSLFTSRSPLTCDPTTTTPNSTSCTLLNNFDHLSFPGVVPRSFLPSAILANLCKPIHLLHSYLSSSSNLLPPPTPPTYSTISRFVLGLLQAHATTSLSSALPPPTQTPFLLLSSLQPHLNFYASRFLPNSFALLLTTHAFACWFNQSPYSTISLLTIAAATTRCDMLVLAAPIGISLLLNSKVTLLKGILTGIFTLTLTFLFIIPLDTVMWNNYSSPMLPPLPFLWAEGVVLFYNTVENKSANWGTSPPYWYLVAMLKALLGCFFFAMLGVFKLRPTPAPPSPHKDQIFSLFNIQVYLNKHLLGYLVPAAVFVALYSILPHKELRFILPAFPIFNVAAAEGLAGVWSVVFFKAKAKAKVDCESSSKVVSPVSTRLRRRKAGATTETTTTTTTTKPQTHHHPPKIISLLLALGSFLLLLFTFLGTAVFLAASHNNYPGGEALAKLHSHILLSSPKPSTIFIDNYAAMSGISRFQQMPNPERFQYVKEGYEAANQHTTNDNTPPDTLTHLICADDCSFSLSPDRYEFLFSTSAYDGIDFKRFSLRLAPKVRVYERIGWSNEGIK